MEVQKLLFLCFLFLFGRNCLTVNVLRSYRVETIFHILFILTYKALTLNVLSRNNKFSACFPYICGMVRIEVTDAVAELRRRYADLDGDISKQVVGALNHTARKARTSVSRQVRARYNIKAKDIKAAIRLGYARANDLETYVEASGRALPLRAFPHRQTKKGVSVSIMKKRHVINKAFAATMKSGHKGVFARGEYGRGKFKFRYQRTEPSSRNDLQINELYTTSIPSAMSRPDILATLSKQINEDFPTRLSHLLGRTSKFGKIR